MSEEWRIKLSSSHVLSHSQWKQGQESTGREHSTICQGNPESRSLAPQLRAPSLHMLLVFTRSSPGEEVPPALLLLGLHPGCSSYLMLSHSYASDSEVSSTLIWFLGFTLKLLDPSSFTWIVHFPNLDPPLCLLPSSHSPTGLILFMFTPEGNTPFLNHSSHFGYRQELLWKACSQTGWTRLCQLCV